MAWGHQMKKFLSLSLVSFFFATSFVMAADKPGGVTRTATNMPTGTHEFLLSPAVLFGVSAPAFLTTEMRFQPSEDIGWGAGFGAGESGFNFGANAVWHIAPDISGQPGIALQAGMYFNRLVNFQQNSNAPLSYFVLKATPIVSKMYKTSWGAVTPYTALQVAPSFRLGETPDNDFSLKSSSGLEIVLNSAKKMRFWTEFGLGLMSSYHEIVLGITYPIEALDG